MGLDPIIVASSIAEVLIRPNSRNIIAGGRRFVINCNSPILYA